MTTIIEENSKPTFAELLEEYEPQSIRQGDYLDGHVLSIDEEVAVIDIGAKQEAVVPTREIERLNEDFTQNISVGDQVPVYVESLPAVGDQLTVSIKKGLEKEDWKRAEELLENQEILELMATGYNKGGVLVKFYRLNGFLPNSHVPQLRRTNNEQSVKAGLVGQTLSVQVLQVDSSRKRLVFSARNAEKIHREKFLKSLSVGQVLIGTVKNLVDFGAFVQIGDADGLVHISELDWKHVKHPSEVLEVDQEIEVLVLSVDLERERVGLSRKALLPSPWKQFANEHELGELIEGTVTNAQDYGAFVQLTEDVVGLLHISEMDTLGASGSPQKMFRQGDKLLARIVEINTEEERIRLSTRSVSYEEYSAWATRDWIDEQKSTDEQDQVSEQEQEIEESAQEVGEPVRQEIPEAEVAGLIEADAERNTS